MPHIVKVNPKKIIINTSTDTILSLYKTSIENNLDEDQQKSLGISLEEIQRKGFANKAKNTLSSFTGAKHGGNSCIFNQVEKTLNDYSFKLRLEYISFLNVLLEEAGKNSTDTESMETNSQHILIYEILIRLITVAVSEEENSLRDGIKFIRAMDTFIDKILENSELSLNEDFKFSLSKNHPKWIEYFKGDIEVIKLIQAPINTFTSILTYLNKVKVATKAHILAECNYIDRVDDLCDNWINTTYKNKIGLDERRYIEELSENYELILDSSQEHKISLLKEKNKSINKDRITDLYFLLNKTVILSEIVALIDNTINISKWVVLLTGKLNLNGLITVIDAHKRQCDTVIDLNKSDIKKNSLASRALVKRNITSGYKITKEVSSLRGKIRELESASKHDFIIESCADNISQLAEYSKNLNLDLVAVDCKLENNIDSSKSFLLFAEKNNSTKNSNAPDIKIILDTDQDNYEDSIVDLAKEDSSQEDNDYNIPEDHSQPKKNNISDSEKVEFIVKDKFFPINGLFSTFTYLAPCRQIERKQDDLKLAVKRGFKDTVEYMLINGVSINGRGTGNSLCSIAQSIYDGTPLIVAVRFDKYEIAKYLLSKEAEVNIVDYWDKTALDYAKENGSKILIDLLKNYGAKTKAELGLTSAGPGREMRMGSTFV